MGAMMKKEMDISHEGGGGGKVTGWRGVMKMSCRRGTFWKTAPSRQRDGAGCWA